MKKALLITLLLGATLGTAAQQKFKIIYGSLENSFTRKAVIGAKAELLLPDSTVIDSMRIREDLDVDQTPSAWFLRTRGSGKYILRFSHESYDTQYVNVNLHFHRREVAIDHGAVLLRRPSREVKLGEVVVRATRIKFFQHGDTMVYNADAFQNTEFDTWHGFALKQHRFQFSFNPHFNYRKYHSSEQNLSGTFASNPAERFGASLADSLASPQAGTLLRSLALNRSLWAMKQNGHQLSADFAAEGILRMSHSSDGITFDATGRYDDQQEDRFRHYPASTIRRRKLPAPTATNITT
jgi:hypothetical protein